VKERNPKIEGSNIIDAIPQEPPCPLGCPECYYNRDPMAPRIPSEEEARGKIVRVNSGHDSNVCREGVIALTQHFKHKFYNTSIPLFDFPGPVVFTCNARAPKYVKTTPNLMAVRLLTNSWDIEEQKDLALFYANSGVPVLVTFMRYWTRKPDKPEDYEWNKHIENAYWIPKTETKLRIMDGLYHHLNSLCSRPFVLKMCGTLWSDKCMACRNCEYLYWRWYHANSGE